MLMIGIALLISAASASSNVVSATGDWSNIPAIGVRGNVDATPFVIDRIEASARSGECRLAGVTRRQIRMNVPFLVQFDRRGAVTEVVVHKLGCPSVESALASAVKLMAERGEYRPTGVNAAGWYRGQFNIESSNH